MHPHRFGPMYASTAAVLCAVATVALVGTQPGVGRGATAGPHSVSRYTVVVSTTADRANGHMSSVAALNARPGRDGISLREALKAADNTGGARTVYIMFSAHLNGKTIGVGSELPPIRRDHLVLEGIAPNGSPARVALDGRHARKGKLGEMLLIQASEVTVRSLRFTGMDPKRNYDTQVAAVQLGQGRIAHAFTTKRISNVQIVDDVFDNTGFDFPYTGSSGGNTGLLANALMLGGVKTHISGVTVARNTFRYFNNDACGVLADSPGDTINGVVIANNTFKANEIPIELGIGGTHSDMTGSHLTGTQIIGNTITPYTTSRPFGSGGSGISIDSGANNGTIEQTLIEGNAISAPATLLLIQAGATFDGIGGSGNVISNTQIINNVLNPTAAAAGGIALIGGNSTTPLPSRISGVTIENDTIVNNLGNAGLFSSVPNGPGASGNQITNVTVRNSILYEPFGIPIFVSPGMNGGEVNLAPDVLTNSLVSGPAWAGKNGNVNGDPNFVNKIVGDFRLAAGSALINAGTTIGAPGVDLAGARRDGRPDIGAFEFGAAARPLLQLTVYALGGSGTVTSTPAAVTCGTVCAVRFDRSASVTLVAKPDRWSRFLGWQGACSGKGRCTLKLDGDKTAAARFGPRPQR